MSQYLADCGYCALEGPDRYGNYDLVVNDDCPLHAGGVSGNGTKGRSR